MSLRQISVYTETGEKSAFTYLKSPSKVMIEKLEPEIVSPEFRKRKSTKRESGSCNRKLDFNELVCEGL